jgi:hypothetical protein
MSTKIDICKGSGFLHFIKPLSFYSYITDIAISIYCVLNCDTKEITGSGIMKDMFTSQPFMIVGKIIRVDEELKEVECSFMMITKYTQTEYKCTIRKNKMYVLSDVMHGIIDVDYLL